jgi:hypothetical protein
MSQQTRRGTCCSHGGRLQLLLIQWLNSRCPHVRCGTTSCSRSSLPRVALSQVAQGRSRYLRWHPDQY